MSATVRDLGQRARARGEPVPLLLALTLQVQVLRVLEEALRRNRFYPRLEPGVVRLRASSLDALLADPTRDPKVTIGGVAAPCPAAEASRRAADAVRQVAAITAGLLGGEPRRPEETLRAADLPGDLAALLREMLAPRAERRPTLAEALSASRGLALERLAAWERGRRGARLEESLRRVLDRHDEDAAGGLVEELAGVAPESPILALGRHWLAGREEVRRRVDEVRADLSAALYARRRRPAERLARRLERLLGPAAAEDADLDLALRWLAEEQRRLDVRRAHSRRTSLKLLLTGAPLVLAGLLCGLLLVVMVWSV